MFEFEWDEANLAHIERHGVSQLEAEQVCSSDTLVIEEYDVDYETRLEEIGETSAGRILKVVTTERDDKLRVVTAYDAVPFERRLFLRSKMTQ